MIHREQLESVEVETSARGVAVVDLVLEPSESFEVEAEAMGETVEMTVGGPAREPERLGFEPTPDPRLGLALDRAVVNAGESLDLELRSPALEGTAHVGLILAGSLVSECQVNL